MRPRTSTSLLHRLAALSKKSLADGSFPFPFRLTDLSTELRWWRPICLCTFKGARPHTRSAFTQADACLRNKLNQTPVLQTSFRIPRLRLPPHPDLFFYSSKDLKPSFCFYFILHPFHCPACTGGNLPTHTAGGHRAAPTQTSAADGRAAQAQPKRNLGT